MRILVVSNNTRYKLGNNLKGYVQFTSKHPFTIAAINVLTYRNARLQELIRKIV